jgi:hypothetical protein
MLLGLAVMVLGDVARGDVVYDNLSSVNTTNGYGFGNHKAYAQKFSSGAGGQIATIKLNLFEAAGGATWSGTFNIQIWTNIAVGQAGSVFLDFYQGTQANIGTDGAAPSPTYTYNLGGSNTALAAGNDYFLVVTRVGATNGNQLDWGAGPGNFGGGSNVFGLLNADSTWTTVNIANGFGAEIVTVPEPGTLLLGGIAAACGGGGVWWRRKRKPQVAETVEPVTAV